MRKTLKFVTIASLLSSPFFVVSCFTDSNDHLAEGGGCDETSSVLALDEVSTLGFSANDLIQLAAGTHQETLLYQDGTTTGLTLTLEYLDGEVRFVDSEPAESESGQEADLIAPYCEDRLEVAVRVTFATDDGAFNEQWQDVLSATTVDSATVNATFSPTGLTGSYVLEVPADSQDYDEAKLFIDATFTAGATQGTVDAQVSGSNEDTADGDGDAWAALIPIATWPASAEQ